VNTGPLVARASGRQIDLALLLLRLFTGFVLVYGTQDNVFDRDHMLEFRDFVAKHGFPAPMFSAYLSAYAQFITGILIALGLLARPAAALMVINFAVALVMVHWSLPFGSNVSPLAMLCNCLLLTITGAGAWSIDARLAARAAAGEDTVLRASRVTKY
jgi:putative oxidoreductase